MKLAKPNHDLTKILKVARQASQDGANVLKSYFGKIGKVSEKSDSSIVSEADGEAERTIRKALLTAFPEFSFVGEEEGLTTAVNSAGTWYVDPLDGTTNFVHGFPYYSTSLGLEIDGEMAVAAVDAPHLNMSLWATKGGGAYLNGERIHVKDSASISECLFATGFSYERNYDLQLKLFEHFLGKARGIRRPGAAVLDLCFTSMGVFSAFWEKGLKSWDMAAGALLVQEAGGVVTELDGRPWSPKSSSILAAGPKLHQLMSKEIKTSIS
jgi:myo-inositol-1(or 4)-monophosphatase